MTSKAFFRESSTAANQLETPRLVISSQALRDAALRASWHRDNRVARRRKAWRWILFWSWKYGGKPALTLAGLAALWWATVQIPSNSALPAWVSGMRWTQQLPAWNIPQGSSDAVPAIKHTPSSRLDTALLPANAQNPGTKPASTPASASNPKLQPLQLKSEQQLSLRPAPPAGVSSSPTSFHPQKDLSP